MCFTPNEVEQHTDRQSSRIRDQEADVKEKEEEEEGRGEGVDRWRDHNEEGEEE